MTQRAITRIPTSRGDLFAFEIDGRIHKPDIEWMAHTLQSAFDTIGQLDIIIVMVRWDGIDLGAVFNSDALVAQARANKHVRKYAVVGAPAVAEAMINLFSPFTPVEEKTFDIAHQQQAWSWIGGEAAVREARQQSGHG